MPDPDHQDEERQPVQWFEAEEELEPLDETGEFLDVSDGASFDEALEMVEGGAIDPSMLSGFSDITVGERRAVRAAWHSLELDVRRNVATMVADIANVDAFEDYSRFFEVLTGDKDAVVRQVAVQGLDNYDHIANLDLLLDLAKRDPSVDVRIAALEGLAAFSLLSDFEMLDPGATKRLRFGLASVVKDKKASADERSAALFSLSVDPGNQDLSSVVESFLASDDPSLVIGAIRAMRNVSTEDGVRILERYARSADVDERVEAAASLAVWDDESIVPILTMMAREDTDSAVRASAIAGLATHGGEAALHSLVTLQQYASDDEIELIQHAIEEVQTLLELDEVAEQFDFDEHENDADDFQP